MEKLRFKNQAELNGWIGGQVSGFKRKEKALFLIGFVKMIEMLEFPNFKLTSSLAKKLIAGFTGDRSIANKFLINEFAEKGNKSRQENLDAIVALMIERHKEIYDEQWSAARQEIEAEARELKQRLMQQFTQNT